MSTILLITIFIIWTIATIIHQINSSIVPKFDIFDIVQDCRFFAPKPLSLDYRFYATAVESELKNDSVYIPLFNFKRDWYNFIWNPNQKLIKSSNDIFIVIYKNIESKSYDLPYLIILNSFNTLFKEDSRVNKFKFIIVSYAGYENEEFNIVFQSHTHNVDRNI